MKNTELHRMLEQLKAMADIPEEKYKWSCDRCPHSEEYICGLECTKENDMGKEKNDVFDRIVSNMDELLTKSEADLVSVNITTTDNRSITLTIQSTEDRK